jgi:hypothetical protein
LLSSPGVAQTTYILDGNEYKGTYQSLPKTLYYEEIDGSPYYSPKLVQGQVKFEGGDTVNYFMRYNMYLDEMEFLKNEQLYSITDTKMLVYLDIGNTRYVYKDYFLNKQQKSGYLVELITGGYSLYRKDRINFEAEKPAKTSFESPTPPSFKPRFSLYLVSIDGGRIQQFNADNSAYGKFPPYEASDIKAYMKQHKLKFKNEEDLIQLFIYLNDQ